MNKKIKNNFVKNNQITGSLVTFKIDNFFISKYQSFYIWSFEILTLTRILKFKFTIFFFPYFKMILWNLRNLLFFI